MTLLELQRQMCDDVRRPLTADYRMQRQTESGQSTAEHVATYIKPNDRLSSFERLEIYNRQYWFRVIDSVMEDFPAVGTVLGNKKFDELVLAFLKDTPSTSYTLRDLSTYLPRWLESHPEYAGKKHDLLQDVARLEVAYIEAFDSAALDPLLESDFAQLSADSGFSLQPHLHLLSLQYPVDELVLAVHQKEPPSEVASNAVVERKEKTRMKLPPMRRKAIYLAVHRYDGSIYYRRIEREAFLLLSSLQQKKTLGEAIELAFVDSRLSEAKQAAVIQACFAHAAQLGWFCRERFDMSTLQ
ncbi:MAG: putative DNA-binding domain-containing protein [Acidobacteriaceae bacterium]|nr:putative DNA-binding domain-containing protein [Acidobacteriaceae bacterium]